MLPGWPVRQIGLSYQPVRLESIPGLLKRFTNTDSELEFVNNLWGPGTEQVKGYLTGPSGYIGWRNLFLEIDSWAS